MVSQKVVIAI